MSRDSRTVNNRWCKRSSPWISELMANDYIFLFMILIRKAYKMWDNFIIDLFSDTYNHKRVPHFITLSNWYFKHALWLDRICLNLIGWERTLETTNLKNLVIYILTRSARFHSIHYVYIASKIDPNLTRRLDYSSRSLKVIMNQVVIRTVTILSVLYTY